MMWWLIFAAPAALVAYEMLDEDRRAAWVKRWAEVNAHTCEFGEHCGRLRCRGPRRAIVRTGGYRARESVNPRTIRVPRGPTGVTPPRPRPGLDTSELQDLLAEAEHGLDRRKIEGQQCYTCELLNREDAGPHEYEHPFEDLVEAERVERDLRPHRSKALWELVNHARGAAKRARASHLSLVEPTDG